MKLIQLFHAGIFKRREHAEKFTRLGQHFVFFKNRLVFKPKQWHSIALQGFAHGNVTVNCGGFVVFVGEHRLYAQFRRQLRNCCFGMVIHQVQIAPKALQLCFQGHAAFPNKLHPSVCLVGQGIQNGFVKHKYAMHLLAMFQGIKQGCVVMGSKVAPKPHQAFRVLARLWLSRQGVVFQK